MGTARSPATAGRTTQEEDAAEVLSEWDGDEMSATEIEADADTSGESASSAPSCSTTTLALTSADIAKIIEASQTKIGEFLFEESDKRWGEEGRCAPRPARQPYDAEVGCR